MGKKEYSLPRSSPLASLTQWIGRTELQINYGRPRVNSRKIWSALVPYNRVWRAGANEATTMRFSTPVTIEGQPLPAGAYTFFAIPGENEWTVIFNRISHQWGAFNYNAEFDALRFPVPPTEAPHEEYLRYVLEPTAANSARRTLHWEKIQISFAIAGGS